MHRVHGKIVTRDNTKLQLRSHLVFLVFLFGLRARVHPDNIDHVILFGGFQHYLWRGSSIRWLLLFRLMAPIRVLFFLRALFAFVLSIARPSSTALALLIDIFMHINFKVHAYSHGLIVLIISCRLEFFSKDFLLVLRNDLDNEVWIGSCCKLLETHVDIWIDWLKVFELFSGKETVILTLILDLVVNSLVESSERGWLLYFVLQLLLFRIVLYLEQGLPSLATTKSTSAAAYPLDFLSYSLQV